MSVQGPFKIDCDEQFPHGLFAVAVGGQLDFEKSQAKAEDPQARDKESGERVWVVRVIDNDPEARTNEFKVKIIAPHCPTLAGGVAGDELPAGGVPQHDRDAVHRGGEGSLPGGLQPAGERAWSLRGKRDAGSSEAKGAPAPSGSSKAA